MGMDDPWSFSTMEILAIVGLPEPERKLRVMHEVDREILRRPVYTVHETFLRCLGVNIYEEVFRAVAEDYELRARFRNIWWFLEGTVTGIKYLQDWGIRRPE